MEKKPTSIKSLKSGSFVIIDDVPCKVDGIQISKPGKHGGAKARLTATGLFDNQKRVIVKPADTSINMPIIEKKAMQVVSFIGDNVQLMDLEDYSMHEIPLPDEFKGQVTEGEEVIVWVYGPHMLIKSKK